MHKKNTFLAVACFICLCTAAQTTKPPAAPAGRPVYNFTSINPKLQYVFVENKPGTTHPQVGDDVMMRMIAICNNRFLYSSAQLNNGKPGTFNLYAPAYKGDINDAIMLMTPGDSIICLADAQSVFTYTNKKMPDYIKPGDKIQYNIRLVSIKPKEQVLKEQQEAMMKAMQDAGAKQHADSSKQQPLPEE